MKCATCGHENPPNSKFCFECGAAFTVRCDRCGEDLPRTAKFCNACGASLVAPVSGDGGERKVVTIVFADLIGSTALHERLDAETARRFMDSYYQAMRHAVEAQGGTVTQFLGDGAKAVFGAPRVAEDDAIRAVRAAVGMQRAFRELADAQFGVVGKTGLRVAVNTGEVVASEKTEIIGDPVNVAARLQEEARDGDVVIGESTQRLVADLVTLAPLGVFKVKGRNETVAAYRVVSLERPAGSSATTFVGREDELRRLRTVYDAAVAARAARLAVVLGSPGLGKSRLLAELARRIGDAATVLTARCGLAGGATFAPIAEALRLFLQVDDGVGGDELLAAIESVMPVDGADRSRIAGGVAALLAGTPAPPEETFFVVRRFLAGLATSRPVVLAIDDLQWAEPLLLDLTEHLVQWATDSPLFVLVGARPELRDTRTSLATAGGLVSDVIALGGLDAGAAMRLAANVIGAEELPAAVVGRILAASEGNPLFVGELVRMLVHDGTLRREGDRWTAASDISRLEMPPTIQALLAARIERLRPEERTVLERAAIVGRQFSRAAVAHLLQKETADLDARLESLRRSELVERDTGWFLGEPALRFHHVLVRDAAYRRLLKGTRAELHGRLADWIEERVGEAVEHDETIGWHLEQAHQHLREIGPIDARGQTIGERAARHLAAAGRRALARDDVPLAANLLGRAIDRLDANDLGRAQLALDWCEALLAGGEVGTATRAIEELASFARDDRRLRAWHTCFKSQLAVLTEPKTLHATATAVAGAAEELASLGDAAGEAKGHFVHALALANIGKVGACEAALDRALAAARRANDRRRANAVLSGAPLAALWGPSPVTRASGRCLDVVRVLRITQGAPDVEAVALRCQAVLEALRGRTDAARRMIASSRRLVEELGITHRLLQADTFAGLIELYEGDGVTAERLLRGAYAGFRDHGLGIEAARAAALLGRALIRQGRADEADTLSRESEALAGDDLQAAIAWRGVRAEALAGRGEHGSAVEFARAAVEIAAGTDGLLFHADARVALTTALRAAGRNREADAEEARAIELWEAKGATLLAERARRDVRQVERVETSLDDRAARPARRHVRPNSASLTGPRLDAIVAQRNPGALSAVFADTFETFDHTTGTRWDREGSLATLRWFLRAKEPAWRNEPLATLGDSLALLRARASASGWSSGTKLDVGAYEKEEILLVEADSEGRRTRAEVFAADHLGYAVVRLYERYAEVLPEGPERSRAEATARSVRSVLGPFDPARFATALTPELDFADHRHAGLGTSRGAGAYLRGLRIFVDLTDEIATRVDDILEVHPDALLVRATNLGTTRTSGGAYERPFVILFVFGTDGLATRIEQYDVDHEAEALARFEALTTLPARPKRRVHPNAATELAGRFDAAIAARDGDALPTLIAAASTAIDHTTGTTWDRRGIVSTWYSVLKSEAACRHEPVAMLGNALALFRLSVAASGVARGQLDVGPYVAERIVLLEVDEEGRCRGAELFAGDRLGNAITRLYERYAELLSEGPERVRAAATSRSLAAWIGPIDVDRLGAYLSPACVQIEHRTLGTWSAGSADEIVEHIRSQVALADAITFRIDDVLALQPDGLLAHFGHSGVDRSTGGRYEKAHLTLYCFAPDGLIARFEMFDRDREPEALARFDELAADPSRAVGKRDRRVRANFATASSARVDAAVAARDAEALPGLLTDEVEYVDHINGTILDREGGLLTLRGRLTSRNVTLRHDPLATLGDFLALTSVGISSSGLTEETLDVGPYEFGKIDLLEADARARIRRVESFAAERLGNAIARLFERYAELLPDGPERTRAAATARSIAAYPLERLDLSRLATAIDTHMEFVDHRPLGFERLRGRDNYLRQLRTLVEGAYEVAYRWDEILGLRPDSFLVRLTNSGTTRAGGGLFEREFLLVATFGDDGLTTRNELYPSDREAEALARFEELTVARRAPERPVRRVQPNAATSSASRFDAIIAERIPDALPEEFADHVETVDHTTGTQWDRQGILATFGALLRANEPACRHESLATLGNSLALFRFSTSASGLSGKTLDVGAYETANLLLMEVDAEGRRTRAEVFALDHLGDAIVRLYERYAELLPDGPERTRGAGIARSLAAWNGPADLDRVAAAYDPSVQHIDHRVLGTWSAQDAKEILRHFRLQLDLAPDFAARCEDVFAVTADALVAQWTFFGTGRYSGGAFENRTCSLLRFGADGRTTHAEVFEAEQEAEALARFDELTTERPAPVAAHTPRYARRRMQPNAATALAARVDAALAARNFDALTALFPDDYAVTDHETGVVYDRTGALFSYRVFLNARDPTHHYEPLATVGESLALCRATMSASGTTGGKFDVGAYEREHIDLLHADAQGRARPPELFAADRLGDAIVRLYERYAELLPDGRGRERAAATARAFAAWIGPIHLDRVAASLSPACQQVDHRTLGTWFARSDSEVVENWRSFLDLADGVEGHIDDVLGASPDAFLVRASNLGTDRSSGGRYERPMLAVICVGPDGLVARTEFFDPDREAEALARFDELTADRKVTALLENAVTHAAQRFSDAWRARDWKRIANLHSPNLRVIDRRSYAHIDNDREQHLDAVRIIFEMSSSRVTQEVLATRGHRLGLGRTRWFVADSDVGPSETGSGVWIIETDDEDRAESMVLFDVDDADALDTAYAELDERFWKGEAAAYPRVSATMRAFVSTFASRNWAALAKLFAPDLVVNDHRLLGTETLHGRDAYVRALRSLIDLAPDARLRLDHVRMSDRGLLWVAAWHGPREGGAFETQYLWVGEVDEAGRVPRFDLYDLEQIEQAIARFAELTVQAGAPRLAKRRVRPNAATAIAARLDALIAARDADALPTLWADELETVDHPTGVTYDREGSLSSFRALLSARDPKYRHEPLATLGDSLAVCRLSISASGRIGAKFDVGAYEIENFNLIEVDAQRRHRRSEAFSSDRLGDAIARLYERYAELLPEGAERTRAAATAHSVAAWIGRIDFDRMAASIAPAIQHADNRALGLPSMRGAQEYRDLIRTLFAAAVNLSTRVDDILALRSDALLGRWSNFGTERIGGGSFERQMLMLFVFGTDGLVTRLEYFDSDRDAEVLARFDELTSTREQVLKRRVRPSGATAMVARMDAALAANDAEGVARQHAESVEVIDHSTGVFYDRKGLLTSWQLLFKAKDPKCHDETLATLGESLVLCRQSMSASEFAGSQFDVGTWEREQIILLEVDAHERVRRCEIFSVDHLGEAITRLYARYAELLPAGPERTRADAAKRSIAAFAGAFDSDGLDRMAAVLAPDVAANDHRRLGTWSATGADGVVEHFRALATLADDVDFCHQDILGLAPGALLVRMLHSGIDRASGGRYDREFFVLMGFGSDGLVTRVDWFDPDRDDEALARFDELTVASHVNVSTRTAPARESP